MANQYYLIALPSGATAMVPLTDVGSNLYAPATSDAGANWTTSRGVSGKAVLSTDASASTGLLVTDAPTTGRYIVVSDLFISAASTLSLTFYQQTTTTSTSYGSSETVIGPIYMAAGGTMQITPRSKLWKMPAATKKLVVVASTNGTVMIDVGYYSEA